MFQLVLIIKRLPTDPAPKLAVLREAVGGVSERFAEEEGNAPEDCRGRGDDEVPS